MGGAAGHMNHPFDLGWVNDGNSLLDFFEKAASFVEKKGAGAVKIDGVNVSFKVVEQGGLHQFAVDRGSLKNIDIEGITMARVDDRFPEGHGMRPAIRTLLTILNKALPTIKSELEQLGMWDDSSLFLNTEYVEGTTNVTEYEENFLAIHGLNQFYQRIAKSGASKGNERPGAERPEGEKKPSVEIAYDPKTMEALIKKLNPIANEYGFQVYGSVPTERLGEIDIDFSKTLAEPLTIRVSDDREITKSLSEWLSEATNPRYSTVSLKSGKKTHPLHKELYKAILDGTVPIVDLIEDSDAAAAIYGAVIMHATRMLGNDILRGLTSPMGDVTGHEGVVLRDEKLFGPNPVKITGEFILGGMGSAFQDDTSITEDDELDIELADDEDADPVVDSDFSAGRTIAIVPGAFKPPHWGHLNMVKRYASIADKVIVLISSPLKSHRTLDDGTIIWPRHSKAVWDLLLSDAGLGDKVDVQVSKEPSSMGATFQYIDDGGPLQAGDRLILGASDKPDEYDVPDWHRWSAVSQNPDKYIKQGVQLMDVEEYSVPAVDRPGGDPYRARDMRSLISRATEDEDALDELEEFVGEDKVFDLMNIFGTGNIQEMSAMSAGAVQGAPTAGGGPWRHSDIERDNEEEKKRSKLKKLKKEKIDLTMIDDVIRLITARGLMR